MVNKSFRNWALSFSGCEGGNIGSQNDKAIWFCGIEWGRGGDDEEEYLTQELFEENLSKPPKGYEDYKGEKDKKVHSCIGWIFNRQAMKILSVINGGKLADYKNFAQEVQPFVSDSKSKYFKMNLYPIAFKNTSEKLWTENCTSATNLRSKEEYKTWIRENRFPVIKNWVKKYAPKLIICVGKTYYDDFKKAFMLSKEVKDHEVTIDEKPLRWFINDNGTLVVNIPFMIGRNGLVKNTSIEKFGKRISELLEKF